MAILVLAYPKLAHQDFDWIQQIRCTHDQRYFDIFAPHFTLIFPIAKELLPKVLPHVQIVAARLKPIPFMLRCALVVKDNFSDFTGVFLVPDEGFGQIVRAHDALYTGILAQELRLDIAYIPHLGIANDLSPIECKRLANKLNRSSLAIAGIIECLDIVAWEDATVQTVACYSLIGE